MIYSIFRQSSPPLTSSPSTFDLCECLPLIFLLVGLKGHLIVAHTLLSGRGDHLLQELPQRRVHQIQRKKNTHTRTQTLPVHAFSPCCLNFERATHTMAAVKEGKEFNITPPPPIFVLFSFF